MEVRPTYLIMVTGENNNKYYNCYPEGDMFRVEYGRVDATKTTRSYPMSKWYSQINSKIKKGYQDVTDLRKDLVQEVSAKNPDSPYKEIENESVRLIVAELQRLARETVQKNYKVSSSAVTQDMVDAAQSCIDELVNIKDDVSGFNDTLLSLFTTIPRKMGDVREYLAKDASDFVRIIADEQALLDVMRGQIYVKPDDEEEVVNKKEQTILEELGLVMEDVDDSEIIMIKRLMNESAGKFRKAWRVTNLQTQNRYDKFVKENEIKDTKLLFHGSRSENWFSIIKRGLAIRPSNAVYTGSMFSDGCYFSPKCQKSIGYTSLSGAYWTHGGNSKAYMALFEVAYGVPYMVYKHDSHCYHINYNVLQNMNPKCHCLHASASKGMLRNDEIVFYRNDQMTIKYLIEIGN